MKRFHNWRLLMKKRDSEQISNHRAQIRSWRTLESRTVFSNHWISLDIDQVELPNGQLYDYTVVRRASHGVAALVFDDENRLLLESEYRYPVDEVIWQLPGGLVNAGEEPLAAVKRELAEETGYVADSWEYLGDFWDNPALGDMKIFLYICRNIQRKAEIHFDVAEFIAAEWKTLNWLKNAVMFGEIRDRVLLSALGMLLARGQCGD
ncbi:MAG: hypothetical protein DSY55_02320 [Clostridia bacterium]|nr:MAG: hypothetical protein DSY55_02320 [Clostridia bacterium]